MSNQSVRLNILRDLVRTTETARRHIRADTPEEIRRAAEAEYRAGLEHIHYQLHVLYQEGVLADCAAHLEQLEALEA